MRELIGDPEQHVANHSILKDVHREADFLSGYLCGLSGMCHLQSHIHDCMPEPAPFEVRESVDALSEGMMHGAVMDNLIMGLFNLQFGMSDYEEAMHSAGQSCLDGLDLESIEQWKEVKHGITHESMSDMRSKINLHLKDAINSSHEMEHAWSI